MTHIVFNEADMPVLKQCIETDETLAGDILLVRDDYAAGPSQTYTRKTVQRPEKTGGDRCWKVAIISISLIKIQWMMPL
jgi:hypothetical protein